MTETPASPVSPEPVVTQKGRSPRVVIGGAVAAVAVLAGGGAFAFAQLSGGGPQPHDVLPSTTQAYARVDLDPSAGQKIALFKLLRKIPEAAKEIGDEDIDLRELLIDGGLSEVCDDIDFTDDVEPWLGERVGIGASITDEQIIVAAQVTDETAARTGIDAIAECSGQELGLGFVDGYALISDTQKSVDDAMDASAKSTLADNTAFADDMDALGETGIASVWIDGDAAGDAITSLPDLAGAGAPDLEQLENLGSFALALRVDGSAIELAGISAMTEAFDVDSAPIGDLPEDTVVGASLSGVGAQIGPQFDQLMAQLEDLTSGFIPQDDPTDFGFDEEFLDSLDPASRDAYEQFLRESAADPLPVPGFSGPDDFLEELEAGTGLTLPDDLEALLGDTFTLAIGRANLETLPRLSGPDDVAALDVAARTQGDPDDAKDVMDKLAALAEQSGVVLVSGQTDDGAVLATNDDAAEAVMDGGSLGDEDHFRDVMPYGDDTLQGFYVDIAAIVDAIRKADPPEEVADGLKQVESITSVGMSGGALDNDRLGFSLRVNFDD